jgi:MFS family permease
MLVQSVGAAWAMTQLTREPGMVALVQTSLMLPLMLWSIPAGALADMYDRRKIALVGLTFSVISAASVWALAWRALLTPTLVLTFCFLVGSGMAVYGPAWQSSVAEQVPSRSLPQAIALNSISYNIARSFGPAIGGVIVAIFGAAGAYLANVLLALPARRWSEPFQSVDLAEPRSRWSNVDAEPGIIQRERADGGTALGGWTSLGRLPILHHRGRCARQLDLGTFLSAPGHMHEEIGIFDGQIIGACESIDRKGGRWDYRPDFPVSPRIDTHQPCGCATRRHSHPHSP